MALGKGEGWKQLKSSSSRRHTLAEPAAAIPNYMSCRPLPWRIRQQPCVGCGLQSLQGNLLIEFLRPKPSSWIGRIRDGFSSALVKSGLGEDLFSIFLSLQWLTSLSRQRGMVPLLGLSCPGGPGTGGRKSQRFLGEHHVWIKRNEEHFAGL